MLRRDHIGCVIPSEAERRMSGAQSRNLWCRREKIPRLPGALWARAPRRPGALWARNDTPDRPLRNMSYSGISRPSPNFGRRVGDSEAKGRLFSSQPPATEESPQDRDQSRFFGRRRLPQNDTLSVDTAAESALSRRAPYRKGMASVTLSILLFRVLPCGYVANSSVQVTAKSRANAAATNNSASTPAP